MFCVIFKLLLGGAMPAFRKLARERRIKRLGRIKTLRCCFRDFKASLCKKPGSQKWFKKMVLEVNVRLVSFIQFISHFININSFFHKTIKYENKNEECPSSMQPFLWGWTYQLTADLGIHLQWTQLKMSKAWDEFLSMCAKRQAIGTLKAEHVPEWLTLCAYPAIIVMGCWTIHTGLFVTCWSWHWG